MDKVQDGVSARGAGRGEWACASAHAVKDVASARGAVWGEWESRHATWMRLCMKAQSQEAECELGVIPMGIQEGMR